MSTDAARAGLGRKLERAALGAIAVGAIALLASGCPGTLADKLAFIENDAGSCGDVPTTLFQPTCAASGCHSAVNPAGQLDLESPDVASRLVDKPANGLCSGTLADPLNPTKSVLYLKLTSAPPCGSRMPLGATPLADSEMACVKSWIAEQMIPGTGGGGGAGGGGASGTGGSAGGGGSSASGGGGANSGGGASAGGAGGTASTSSSASSGTG